MIPSIHPSIQSSFPPSVFEACLHIYLSSIFHPHPPVPFKIGTLCNPRLRTTSTGRLCIIPLSLQPMMRQLRSAGGRRKASTPPEAADASEPFHDAEPLSVQPASVSGFVQASPFSSRSPICICRLATGEYEAMIVRR